MAPIAPTAPRRSIRIVKVAAGALPVEDNNRVTKPRPPKFDCSTCRRSLAASAFYKRHPTTTCKHDIHTCKQCLKAWITAQLEASTYDKLSCPECPEIMSNANVKAFATKETYAKYDEIERRAFQEKTPGWMWCRDPKCRAGQVHEALLKTEKNAGAMDDGKTETVTTKAKTKRGRGKKKQASATSEPLVPSEDLFICDTCDAKACIPCDRPYHEGETCAEYQKRLQRQQGEEEEASLAQIQNSCKPCPKCSKNIEKHGGCDQVYCTQCRTSFCWICTKEYRLINQQGHAQGCIYAEQGRFDPHAAQNAPGNFVPWMQ